MDSRNLSIFSWVYWKTKFEYIFSILYLFYLCFFPLPEKKGIKTASATDNGRGGYDNNNGLGKRGYGGCGSGGWGSR